MDLRLRPHERFHHGGDFTRVFNRQQKAAGRWVVVLVAPRLARGGTPAPARIGVMVSTKVAKSAVRRHQLKRWVRELFRLRLKQSAPSGDIVVLLRADPPADAHADFAAEITRLHDQALRGTPLTGGRGPRRGGGRGGPPPSGPRRGEARR